tara:strand:+ start:21 stop:1010 length:990 start_codon:yes stop_codon:yes gene_type:complete
MSLGRRLMQTEAAAADVTLFKPLLYSGNGGSQSITGTGFQPDLIWWKARNSSSYNWKAVDSINGITKNLYLNLQNALASDVATTSFDSDGFTFGSGGNGNVSSLNYVSYSWKGANSSSSNSNGSVASTVSANVDGGFSIVKWTGDGSTTQTVGHGLSSAPEIVIMKSLSSSAWYVLTTVISGTNPAYLRLDSTDIANSATFTSTSTTFTNFSYSGDTIAYCWHSVSGNSKISTYTGDGSGVTVNDVGFAPSFVLIKNTTQTDYWGIFDNKRPSGTGNRSYIYPNTADVEDVYSGSLSGLTLTSTGFAIDNTNSHMVNQTGETYIYMAFK